jgi:HAD superfamily hydrolase (TIGR01484 family)
MESPQVSTGASTRAGLRPLGELRPAHPVRGIFCDIDDTLTDTGSAVPAHRGRLVPEAYAALCAASEAGLKVVPVTGRPAGWAEVLALLWPVDAVVAENGAVAVLVHRVPGQRPRTERLWWDDEPVRREQRARLMALQPEVLAAVPGTRITDDSLIRFVDLAFDVGENVQLGREEIDRIVAVMRSHGARTLVSTVHAHAFYGDHDKARMAERVARLHLGEADPERVRESFVFVGDSPNDQAAFSWFPLSVGVANVTHFLDRLDPPPVFVARSEGGQGFAEVVQHLLALRRGTAP